MGFTKTDYRLVYLTSSIGCILSVVSSSVFILYIILRSCLTRFRSPKHTLMQRPIRFLFYLHVDILSHSLMHVMANGFDYWEHNIVICKMQSVGLMFFIASSNLLLVTISLWILYELILIKRQSFSASKQKLILEIVAIITILVVSLLYCSIPLALNKIGRLSAWCHLNDPVWLWSYHFGFIIACVAFLTLTNSISICIVLCSCKDRLLALLLRDKKTEFVTKLICYPVLVILIYSLDIAFRAITFSFHVTNDFGFVLFLVMVFLFGAWGLWYLLMFVLNVVCAGCYVWAERVSSRMLVTSARVFSIQMEECDDLYYETEGVEDESRPLLGENGMFQARDSEEEGESGSEGERREGGVGKEERENVESDEERQRDEEQLEGEKTSRIEREGEGM